MTKFAVGHIAFSSGVVTRWKVYHGMVSIFGRDSDIKVSRPPRGFVPQYAREESRARMLKNNPMKNREIVARVSAKMKGRKGHAHTKEEIDKISKAHLGLGHTEETRKILSEKAKARYREHPELADAMRLRRLALVFPKKDTKIELLLQNALMKRGAEFIKHPSIEGCQPDMYLSSTNTVIFADGCYWHGCPEHCRKFGKIQEVVMQKDKRQERNLQLAGYKILRFWEHDILNNLSACIDKIV
jgi:DNA mismatch endonuclease (patch repair protein)